MECRCWYKPLPYFILSCSYAQDVPYMHMCATKEGNTGAMDNIPNKSVRKAKTNQHKDVSPPGITLVAYHGHCKGSGVLAVAWSPDGKYIAAKLPTERRTDLSMRKNGDYILIQAEPPYTRRTLLNNGSSRIDSLLAFDFYGLGYSGPAIWSPDGNFLVVGRYHGEELRPYVIDAMTGVTARLSRRACGPSLGGRP